MCPAHHKICIRLQIGSRCPGHPFQNLLHLRFPPWSTAPRNRGVAPGPPVSAPLPAAHQRPLLICSPIPSPLPRPPPETRPRPSLVGTDLKALLCSRSSTSSLPFRALLPAPPRYIFKTSCAALQSLAYSPPRHATRRLCSPPSSRLRRSFQAHLLLLPDLQTLQPT